MADRDDASLKQAKCRFKGPAQQAAPVQVFVVIDGMDSDSSSRCWSHVGTSPEMTINDISARRHRKQIYMNGSA